MPDVTPLSARSPADATPSSEGDDAVRMLCARVEGGNRPIHASIELPGIRGVVFSRPCGGGRGGDVYYLTVCGSGLLSRMCVADVAGHGEAVAGVSAEMQRVLRRLINWPDQRKFMRDLNRDLERRGLDAMTTAATCSYYPPKRQLSYSYAGHPPGWYYTLATESWERLTLPPNPDDGHWDVALAVITDARYARGQRRVAPGDRLLLVTDGVLEAFDARRRQFGAEGVDRVLREHRALEPAKLGARLLDAVAAHGGGELDHDDVTFLLVEFGRPPGPAWWVMVRNRLGRLLGRGERSPA